MGLRKILTHGAESTTCSTSTTPLELVRTHTLFHYPHTPPPGFSFSDKMPETQMEVTNNLYEFLQQWYTLFPMYQASEAQLLFCVLTDSFPPEQPLLSLWRVLCGQICALTDPAHPREEPGGQRQDPVRKDCRLKILCFATRINLAGMGIGDGWMSPYHNARYAKFLYQVFRNRALPKYWYSFVAI